MGHMRDEIPAVLGIPVIAEVPMAEDGSVPSPPGEPFLEGIRFLRAELQSVGLVKPINTLVPAVPSDASMTVARYVGRSLVETGRRGLNMLVSNQRELTPLFPLPAGAELPGEVFVDAEKVYERLQQEQDRQVAVIYCPPVVASLVALQVAETTVLMADESSDIEQVRSAMAACDAAMAPPVAAVVLGRPRSSRWPSLLQRFMPSG